MSRLWSWLQTIKSPKEVVSKKVFVWRWFQGYSFKWLCSTYFSLRFHPCHVCSTYFFLNEGFHPRNLQGQGEWPWADNGCMYEVSLLLNRRVSRKFLDVKTCVFRGLDFILATDPVWRVVTPNRLGVAVVMDLSYDSGLFSHSLKRSR